jgi:hypothetical protein
VSHFIAALALVLQNNEDQGKKMKKILCLLLITASLHSMAEDKNSTNSALIAKGGGVVMGTIVAGFGFKTAGDGFHDIRNPGDLSSHTYLVMSGNEGKKITDDQIDKFLKRLKADSKFDSGSRWIHGDDVVYPIPYNEIMAKKETSLELKKLYIKSLIKADIDYKRDFEFLHIINPPSKIVVDTYLKKQWKKIIGGTAGMITGSLAVVHLGKAFFGGNSSLDKSSQRLKVTDTDRSIANQKLDQTSDAATSNASYVKRQ